MEGDRVLRWGLLNQMATSESGSGMATGFRTRRSKMENIAVFAPIATARVRITIVEKPALFRSVRAATRKVVMVVRHSGTNTPLRQQDGTSCGSS
jgi:hypothetical protein